MHSLLLKIIATPAVFHFSSAPWLRWDRFSITPGIFYAVECSLVQQDQTGKMVHWLASVTGQWKVCDERALHTGLQTVFLSGYVERRMNSSLNSKVWVHCLRCDVLNLGAAWNLHSTHWRTDGTNSPQDFTNAPQRRSKFRWALFERGSYFQKQ